MTSLRRTLTLALLAVWLVATQHCGLEAAGWWDAHPHHAPACCIPPVDCCELDGCDAVERTSMPLPNPGVKPAAAVLDPSVAARWATMLVPAGGARVPEIAPPEVEGLAGWVNRWSFERRAALPPRAP